MCEGEVTCKNGSLENNPKNPYICVKEKEQVNMVVQKIILETPIYMREGEGTSKHGSLENNHRNPYIYL